MAGHNSEAEALYRKLTRDHKSALDPVKCFQVRESLLSDELLYIEMDIQIDMCLNLYVFEF